MKTTSGKKRRPRNVLLYGEHKSGKTTLASTFPGPIILDIEGGSDDINVTRTERLKSLADIQDAISWLITEANEYRTIIIDSVDWMESLVRKHVAETYGETSIEGTTKGSPLGYGKGYKYTAEAFDHFVSGFRRLNELGKSVVLICHSKVVKHLPPNGDSYDRIEPDLHDRVQSLLCEFVDEILFLTQKSFTKTEDLGFKRERKIAVDTNERVLITADTASVVAGNRLGMPREIPATFAAYASYIGDREPTENIKGIVNNGSSKKPATNTLEKAQVNG